MTMIIKVQTWIYVEVADEAQAEAACMALRRLDDVIAAGFPAGAILDAEVVDGKRVGEQEAQERGLRE